MQHELTTEIVALSTLQQFPGNPRNGDVELIAESIQVNGQYKPLIVATDGTILAGNHTFQALLSQGHTETAVIRLAVEAGSVEAKRIILADNRTSDVGAHKYDDGLLLDLLNDVGPLLGTGYNDYDVNDLSPVFTPEDDNPRLDELSPVECPECGHQWVK